MNIYSGRKYARENTVEDHLCTCVKLLRGLCLKLPALLYPGIPDRLVLLPEGRMYFVELKRPKGGRFEPLQERVHAKLRALGFTVLVLYTKEQVNTHFGG